MNLFEKIVYALQFEMERPTVFGWYHLCWMAASVILILFLALRKEKNHERSLKVILLVYGIVALLLEITKQVIWSYHFDPATGVGTWSYLWYSAPFQLCTTPIITCLISAFLKKGKLRDWLLSYTAFVTILGSIATGLYPEACFVNTVLVDIHTMYLHFGSLVVSLYLICSGEILPRIKNLFSSWIVFIVFAAVAQTMNMIVYHSGVLNGNEFNMFYISPYFISPLPVFNSIQQSVPYPVFIILYFVAVFLGSGLIFLIDLGIRKLASKIKEGKKKKTEAAA